MHRSCPAWIGRGSSAIGAASVRGLRLNETALRFVYPLVTLRSYKDAIFGLPPTARTFVETWSHVQPDGTHVVSARLRDGRVIRCIGPQGPDARYPGAPPCPYRELRAWIRCS